MCALMLLALVFGLGRFVESIPLAALAGILTKIGWDIIDWRFLVLLHRFQRQHLFVLLMTLGLTVFVDLVTAVAMGLIAAGMITARQLERLELDSVVSVPMLDRAFLSESGDTDEADLYAARVGLVVLRGTFTVASAHKLVDVIGGDIKDHDVVILDFSSATYIDDSSAMVIEQLLTIAEEKRTGVIVTGLAGQVADILRSLRILEQLPNDCIVQSLDEARQAARALLRIDAPE